MRKNRLFWFLSLTFFITWICWWLTAFLTGRKILSYGAPGFMILYLTGGLGPTIAAYVSVFLTGGKAEIKEFNTRVFKWRVDFYWYIIPLLLSFGIAFVTRFITFFINESIIAETVMQPWYMVFPLFITMIIGGGLEELGWRGVVLPHLQNQYNLGSLPVSFVIGLIWALWHLPLFFIQGTGQYGTNFWVFSLGVIGSSFIFTWLYNKTGSILICVIYHAAFNTVFGLGILSVGYSTVLLLDGVIKLLVGIVLLSYFPPVRGTAEESII